MDHDSIRKGLYSRLGIEATKKRDPTTASAEIQRMTDQLERVMNYARPRLVMGGLRHGSDWDHEGLMKYIQKKFDLYHETGNYEMLVDVINLAVVEGELKTHPNHHFKAVDRKE